MCIAAPHCRTHSTQLRTPCASPSTFGAPPHQLQTRSAYITISGPISTPNILGGYSAPFGYLVLGRFAPNKLLKCHWIFPALTRRFSAIKSRHTSALGDYLSPELWCFSPDNLLKYHWIFSVLFRRFSAIKPRRSAIIYHRSFGVSLQIIC